LRIFSIGEVQRGDPKRNQHSLTLLDTKDAVVAARIIDGVLAAGSKEDFR
jgi:hypothetical protein